MFKPGDFHKSFPTLTTLIILMSSVCFRTSLSVVLLWMKEHFFFFFPSDWITKEVEDPASVVFGFVVVVLVWFG